MEAVIDKVEFLKEIDGKHGKLFSFAVSYEGERAIYRSKSKDQKYFIPGKKTEFTEEDMTFKDKKTGNDVPYKVIKPIYTGRNPQSNFGKALKKEQARYSAMVVSYAKDLVIAGRIQLNELQEYSWVMFELIKEMDKTFNE